MVPPTSAPAYRELDTSTVMVTTVGVPATNTVADGGAGAGPPWVSGSPNQSLGEPVFLQLLCAAFSSRAHLAEWYYFMIMGGLCHQARAFGQ